MVYAWIKQMRNDVNCLKRCYIGMIMTLGFLKDHMYQFVSSQVHLWFCRKPFIISCIIFHLSLYICVKITCPIFWVIQILTQFVGMLFSPSLPLQGNILYTERGTKILLYSELAFVVLTLRADGLITVQLIDWVSLGCGKLFLLKSVYKCLFLKHKTMVVWKLFLSVNEKLINIWWQFFSE